MSERPEDIRMLAVRPDPDSWYDEPNDLELGRVARRCVESVSTGASVARSQLTIDGKPFVLLVVPGKMTEDNYFEVIEHQLRDVKTR